MQIQDEWNEWRLEDRGAMLKKITYENTLYYRIVAELYSIYL